MRQDLVNIGSYLAVLVTMLDQASKVWLLKTIEAQGPVMTVTGFLNFRLSWNKGVTFGLMNDLGIWMPYVLMGLALAIVGLLVMWLRRSTTLIAALGLGFVMGGAVGNIFDRLRYGAVVDFIDVHYAGHHWYTFNLADSAIVAGVCLLMLENFTLSRKKG